MGKDPYGSNYQRLREGVMKRNGGICAFNGIEKAEECHHGMINYPDHKDLTEDQLVQLSKSSHDLATAIRKFQWRLNATPTQIVDILLAYMHTEDFMEQVRSEVTPRVPKARPGRSEYVREFVVDAPFEINIRPMKVDSVQRDVTDSL